MALGTLTAAPRPPGSGLAPNNQGYFALNPYVTPTSSTPTNPYTAILAPNTGYGLLNPGTTIPGTTTQNQGGVGGTGAGLGLNATPNFSDYYMGLLNNDPLLQQELSGFKASDAANQASLQGSEKAGLIGYGSIPASLASIPGLAGALDQTTRDLASQNTASGLSTYAKLQNAYKNAVSGTNSNLAARGMLRSGAFGQENAQNLLGYNQAQDTAVQQLNQYLAGIYNGYLGQQQGLQQQEFGAYNDALMRLIAEIQAGLITAPGGGGGGGGGGAHNTNTGDTLTETYGPYPSAYGGPYYQNPGANVRVTSTQPIPRPGQPVYA